MGSFLCSRKPLGDAILCRTAVGDEIGSIEVRRVVEPADVGAANHYVACHPCPGHHDTSSHDGGVGEDGWFIEGYDIIGYYTSVGALVVHTVRNGDCAFDVMCLMAGEPRTDARII